MPRADEPSAPERHRTARVQSLDRGVALLEAIADANRPVSIAELAVALELSTSTTSRLAATLRDRGLLVQQEVGGPYSLGLQLLRLARSTADDNPLEVAAAPVIARLVRELGETVSLSAPAHDGILYVRTEAPPDRIVSIRIPVGAVLPFSTTAAGKVMLAFMSPARRESLIPRTLDRRTRLSIVTHRDLLLDLDRVRERGYALDLGESDHDVACVGAPIFIRAGEPLAALSCSMTMGAATNQRLASVGSCLIDGASEIQRAYLNPSRGSGGRRTDSSAAWGRELKGPR